MKKFLKNFTIGIVSINFLIVFIYFLGKIFIQSNIIPETKIADTIEVIILGALYFLLLCCFIALIYLIGDMVKKYFSKFGR